MEEEICEDDDLEELETESAIGVYNKSEVDPEIVEIGEENDDHSQRQSRDGGGGIDQNKNNHEVYVAVGKSNFEVLKWALDHVVLPGSRVNLIHVFPPLSFISNPVGKLRVNQLGPEKVKVYANEDQNKRKSILHKYIRLCVDKKVKVDTMLIEAAETTKAILDLIPVLNITSLIMGTKHQHSYRWLIKGLGKGVSVQKSAPDYCKVSLVYLRKRHMITQALITPITSSFLARSEEGLKPLNMPMKEILTNASVSQSSSIKYIRVHIVHI